jgi:hypothetical protein
MIAIGVVVLCCFCVVAAAVGYYAFTTTTPVELSEVVPVPQANDDDLPPVKITTAPPAGGLGNDILKQDTWELISTAAVAYGCDIPIGEKSTIEVLQQPSADGIWYEKWTVGCFSIDDEYPFEVEFILDDTGATFNIRLLDE